MALRAVQALNRLGITTIGAGGVYTQDDLDAMLSAEALAVQVDSALWRCGGTRLFA
jgi:dihydroorotate dehydrogenase